MNVIARLQEFARREPFQPFTLHIAGGRKLPVYHPEYLGFISEVTIVVVWTEDDVAVLVNPMLILEIEEHSPMKK